MRYFTRRISLLFALLLMAGQGAWGQDPASIGSIQYNGTLGAYEINSVANLNDLAVYVNGSGTYSTSVEETTAHDCSEMTFKQTADIDMQGVSYTPIGVEETAPFKGTYDGDGYFVKNISHSISGANNHSGFVGRLEGTVKNVNLKDCNFTAYRAGGIAGGLGEGSVIQSCNVIGGTITGTDTNPQSSHGSAIGGIVGYNYKQQAVDNCFVTAAFSGDARDKGPVVGRTSGEASSIINCYYVNTPGGNTIGTQVTVYAITLGDGITVTGNFRTVGKTATNTYYFGKEGDVITLNKAGFSGTYYVNDEAIVGNTFTMPAADVTITDSDWRDLQTQLTNSSTDAANPTLITLDRDIVATSTDSYLEIPAGHHVIIDLNGHKIDRNLTESRQYGYVIKLSGKSNNHASLVIRDSQGGGQITGGFDGTSNGQSYAGGIDSVYGDLTLEGGSICGNKCTFSGGGGVWVGGGTFTMTGGTITGNVVNTIKDSPYAGGAIYGNTGGDIYLLGGSITGNIAYGSNGDQTSGGYTPYHGSDAVKLHLSGTFTLSGNQKLMYDTNTGAWTKTVDSDYMHFNNDRIYIDGPISPTAPIAIELQSGYDTRLTSGWSTHMGNTEADGYFTLVDNSQGSGKIIGVRSGNLYIGTPEEVYWQADANHDGTTAEKAYIITTPRGLDYLAQQANSTTKYKNNCYYFKLRADITYPHTTAWNDSNSTENNYTVIGKDFDHTFNGRFDGDGHTISGIRIHPNTDKSNKGLFGYIGVFAIISNVTITDYHIVGSQSIGGIAGLINGGKINDCVVKNSLIKGSTQIGGIAGQCQSAASPTIESNFVCDVVIVRDDSGSKAAAVAGVPSNNTTLTHNYYHSSTLNADGTTDSWTSGIGIGNPQSDIAGGAEIVSTLSLGTGVTATATAAYTYDHMDYYTVGTTVTLAHGEAPAGYNDFVGYIVKDAGDHDVTVTEEAGVYSFEMPASDVTVTAVWTARATLDITAHAGAVSAVKGYWTTFYHGTLNYQLPAGAQAFTMDSNHQLVRVGTDGRIIPADRAVVILAEADALTAADAESGTLTLTRTDSTADIHGTNILHGSDSAVTLTDGKVDGKTPYVLSLLGTPAVLGFYQFSGPTIPANKAYYLQQTQ